MQLCQSCGGSLCYPTWWRERPQYAAWEVTIRCPDCECVTQGVYSHREVVSFDEVLNFGTDAVVNGLVSITKHNMESYAAKFVTALQGDHLLPEDF